MLVGVGYQQDEPVAMAAPATNEVTALIALEFHLKLMIPSGGPNLAPPSRWTAPAFPRGHLNDYGEFLAVAMRWLLETIGSRAE